MQEGGLALDAQRYLDMEVIETLRELEEEEGPGFFDEMVGLFVKDSTELVKMIVENAKQRDFYSLTQTAHKLKGSSISMGAFLLSDLCEKIEKKGKKEEIAGMKDLLVNLVETYKQTRSAFRKLQSVS